MRESKSKFSWSILYASSFFWTILSVRSFLAEDCPPPCFCRGDDYQISAVTIFEPLLCRRRLDEFNMWCGTDSYSIFLVVIATYLLALRYGNQFLEQHLVLLLYLIQFLYSPINSFLLTYLPVFNGLKLVAKVLLLDFKASVPDVTLIVQDTPPQIDLKRAVQLAAAGSICDSDPSWGLIRAPMLASMVGTPQAAKSRARNASRTQNKSLVLQLVGQLAVSNLLQTLFVHVVCPT